MTRNSLYFINFFFYTEFRVQTAINGIIHFVYVIFFHCKEPITSACHLSFLLSSSTHLFQSFRKNKNYFKNSKAFKKEKPTFSKSKYLRLPFTVHIFVKNMLHGNSYFKLKNSRIDMILGASKAQRYASQQLAQFDQILIS